MQREARGIPCGWRQHFAQLNRNRDSTLPAVRESCPTHVVEEVRLFMIRPLVNQKILSGR